MSSWKSTVSGILSFIMATAGVLTSFAAAQLVADPAKGKVWVSITAGCTLASALGKSWIGLISKDAETITSSDVAKANVEAVKAASKDSEVKP